MRALAVLLAGGSSERFGGDKLTMRLSGDPLWRLSYQTLLAHPRLSGVGIVAPASKLEDYSTLAPNAVFVVAGGPTRQQSCKAGLEALPDCDLALVHDAARPFVSDDLIERLLDEAERTGAAAPATPSVDTLRIREGSEFKLIDRERVIAMQTPQVAKRNWLLEAHRNATAEYTDEMALLEASGHPVSIVDGDPANFKVTTQADLLRARANLLGVEVRTGIGYDVHAFSSDSQRPLMLGGVRFHDVRGLEGHSDADALSHAIVDAILGAACLGDIGTHFPNGDPRWGGQSSLLFLERAAQLAGEQGWTVEHVDATIIAEHPKVMARSPEMRSAIGSALGIGADRISVKATTNEGLGAIGRGEGIAAFATATLRRT